MISYRLWIALALAFSLQTAWAQADFAPAVPDLNLPVETEEVVPAAIAEPAVAVKEEVPAPKKAVTSRKKRSTAKKNNVPPVTNTVSKVNTEKIEVARLAPVAPVVAASENAQTVVNADAQPTQTATGTAVAPAAAAGADAFEPARDTVAAKPAAKKALQRVSYNPPTQRDPTLSPDDRLLLKHREEERLRAQEAERQRKLAAERRRLAEIERQRQLELERLRDPSREIRGKIRVNGIIGQEVFIGNKVYSVGKTVLGARIIEINPDSVVFQYKGQKFTKKVQLQ